MKQRSEIFSQGHKKNRSRPVQRAACFVLVSCFSVGCATYQHKVDEARGLFIGSDKTRAVEKLEPLANKVGDDQLVYLLDYAVALQEAKRYKESAQAFIKAEKIADIQDYHSVSKVATSLLLSEEMVQYKGEDFEKVLINALNAINFLMVNDLDAALVEVRRLNEKLYKYKFEAKRNYEQNPYAFYLSAMIWEADRKWDDAYIDYKKVYDLAPDFPRLKEDLLRTAIKAQRPDDVAEWKKKFPDVQIRPEWKDPSLGELVLIYQQGWGPRKYPRPENQRYPKLYPVSSVTQFAQLQVFPLSAPAPVPLLTKANPKGKSVASTGAAAAVAEVKPTGEGPIGTSPENSVGPTETPIAQVGTDQIYSVEEVAIKTLDDAYAELVARRIGGVVAKAVVADQIRQKNKALGEIAWIAMNLADRADLRQWSTLPRSFQIARVYLKPGKYKVRIDGMTFGGAKSGESMADTEIEIKPGKKTFTTWRSFK